MRSWPDPDGTGAGGPPYEIRLAAWAVDVAAELYEQFGPDVELVVGFLHYPLTASAAPSREHAVGGWSSLPCCPPAIVTAPAESVVVRSGHDVRTTLVVRNEGTSMTRIRTNGTVTALIVDPHSRQIAGGFAGVQTMALVTFELVPGYEARVPLLVGTASLEPHLGFAVPPGEWTYTVELDLEPGGRCWLPEAPLSILP